MKEIVKGIRYIGVDHLDLDLFESQYTVPEGMAYNSYLIVDEKVAILDTADARKGEEWLRNLEAALEGRKPDYLVIHHMEPDHSATVAPVLDKYPDVTVVGSAMALKFLGQFMPEKPVKNTLAVKEGDTLTLGSHTLKFIAAPMVHWPEVMVSLDTATGVLFSADAFGKFGALSKTAFWADEDPDWACEGRRYYFNICGKYGPQVQALLKKLGGESISVIAPLHGPIIRKDLNYFLNLYNTWSSYGVETEGVFVAFASIHGGTAKVAEMVAEKLKALGCPKVAVSDLARDDRAEAVEDAFRYGRMVLAACSYDAGLFTPAHDFLHSLQVKGYSKRKVALIENGSWAPSAARVMKEMLGAMKDVEIVGEPVTIRSRYKEADEPALDALCKAILS
ncbi:MAG: FprA family A-type flavoprotein [Bacteroidales bacterium]|nr:FprA family A-type flavoprotein [Bacteroidales bacterium]